MADRATRTLRAYKGGVLAVSKYGNAKPNTWTEMLSQKPGRGGWGGAMKTIREWHKCFGSEGGSPPPMSLILLKQEFCFWFGCQHFTALLQLPCENNGHLAYNWWHPGYGYGYGYLAQK